MAAIHWLKLIAGIFLLLSFHHLTTLAIRIS